MRRSNRRYGLDGRTPDDDPRVILGRVGADVGEVEIAGDEGAVLRLTDLRDQGIGQTCQLLFRHVERVMLVLTELLRDLDRQILVRLEPHQMVPGRVTTFSRASSAAYCNAAGMSSGARVG
jgi:hypothetical protein